MNKRLLILCAILNLCSLAGAQDSFPTQRYLAEPIIERSFDKDNWREAKDGIDFRDEMRVDRYDEDFSDEENGKEGERRNIGGGGSSSVLGFLFKAMLVIGAVALLGFLLSRFLGSGGITMRKNRKIDGSLEIDLEQIEEELIESDVERMLRLAVKEENYPLALRLKYLTVIKSLFLNGYTRWKKDKTNRQYFREIQHPERKAEFSELTLAFERVWYGFRDIDKADYEQIEPAFSSFLEKIAANPVKNFEPI